MLWFWFVVAIVASLGGAAAWVIRRGIQEKKRAARYSMDGEGWLIVGGLVGLLAFAGVIVLAATAIDRHVSKQVCAKRDRVSSSEYTWVDFHYFNYECLLVTPEGNITETPVLPIENMGGPLG